MAVLANKRHTSGIEYENTLTKYIRYMGHKLNRIPKRLSYYLATPFQNAFNEAYNVAMDLSENYKSGDRASTERYKSCKQLLDVMHEIAALSYTYWFLSFSRNDLKYVSLKTRVCWANYINREISLIIGVAKQCKGYKEKEVSPNYMNALNSKDFNKVIFISNLQKLNNIIYRRASTMSKKYPDVQMGILVSLAREGLYCAIQGNHYPNTKIEYEIRKKHFTNLINIIHKMNRPIKELATNDIFTESELSEMGNLMNGTLNIITSLQETDEVRFGNL